MCVIDVLLCLCVLGFLLSLIHHTSYITHHTSHIIHHTSYVIHHTSYIIRHTSYIIHHTSYIIHHTSYITHTSSQQNRWFLNISAYKRVVLSKPGVFALPDSKCIDQMDSYCHHVLQSMSVHVFVMETLDMCALFHRFTCALEQHNIASPFHEELKASDSVVRWVHVNPNLRRCVCVCVCV